MPRTDNQLSGFCKNAVWDLVMFGFVQGMTRGLPGVPKEKALAIFAAEFGITGLNLKSKRNTYDRMWVELKGAERDERQATKQPEQA